MVMIDPERIQRLAAKMGNRKDALEMVHQMRCGGKKYPDGGKFFRTNLQNESPLMYQPMVDINYPIETPLRFRPQPDLGDYQAPVSTGMVVNYPISLPDRAPVAVSRSVSAPVIVETPVENLFSDEMIARRALKQRYAESAFDDKAKSHAGAQGAWQIMPITLKDYLGRGKGKAGDLNDPEYNRRVRDWVMGIIPRDLKEFWSEDDSDRAKLAKLYAAYNWGAGNLRGFLRKKQKAGVDISNPDNWVDDLNPETRRYVKYLAFDEDIPDSVYTNSAFEDAARKRGYMAEGGRLYEMGGPSGPAAPGVMLAKYVQDLIDKYKVAAPVAKKAIDMFSGNSNEVVHLGEFMDAFNALPEPMKKRAIEVAMRATHNPEPYNALENYLFSAKNKEANPLDDVKYIITGHGSPSLNINDGLYHEVLTNGKYVLRSPDVKTENDVIDAVVYGKPLNPNIGTQVTDGDFGILRSYKDRVYPDRNIQFVQTNPPGISTSQEGIESMGVIHPSAKNYFNSTFKTSDPHVDIDNAGYSMEYGNRNDSTFVRAWDIYDFASPAGDSAGYKSRWGIDRHDSQDKAVDAIQNMITPLFIRTPWVYYKDASKIVNDDMVQYGIENNINARASGGRIHVKSENRGRLYADGGPEDDGIYLGELQPAVKLAEEPLFVDTPYTRDDFFKRWYPNRQEQLAKNMAMLRDYSNGWPFGQMRKAKKNVAGYTQSMLQNMDENLKEYSLIRSIWDRAYPHNSAYDPNRKWMFPDALKDEEARRVLADHISRRNKVLENNGIEVSENLKQLDDNRLRAEAWDNYGFSYSDDPYHIFYSSAWPSDGTIIHERTHTLRPLPGEYEKYARAYGNNPMEHAAYMVKRGQYDYNGWTGKTKDNLFTEAGHNESDISYYANPHEIVARLNALRFNLGINPNRVITQDDLDEIRKRANKKDREEFLDLYTDEALLRFFNEVADAGEQESLYGNHLGNISANGGNLFLAGGPGSITGISPLNMLVPFVDKTIEKITEGDTAKKIANWYHNHADKIPPRLHRAIYNTIKESAFGNDALSELKYNFIPNLLEDVKYSEYGGMGSADNVFLMSPEQQKRQLESLGWKQVDTSGGYGLVNAAVQRYKNASGRDVPMYQVGEDEISREELIPVGDFTYHPILNYTWVIDEQDPETGYINAQHTQDKLMSRGDTAATPSRYYRDKDGNLYYKEWDFFDHGDYSRSAYDNENRGGYVTRSLTDMSQQYGNILDIAGNPFVKTTGYTSLTDDPLVIKNALSTIVGYDKFYDEYKEDAEAALKDIKSGLYDVKANGGSIHIKLENRGKFTALKKRTGHSASWFKAHGTPAQKKMAVFALNSKKWKHGDGGPLDRYGDEAVRNALLRLRASKTFEDGGDSGQKPKNTEEYINQQRDAARVLAHENSLKQAHQVVPVMGYVDGSPVYGDSCLYTALDNYGNPKYMVPGNTQFFNMPEKYGFMKIPVKDALPGDVVQRGGYNDFDSGYVPTHGMIFDGYDANGNPLFNYSRGSREPDAPSDIRIHSPYQHEPMDDFFYRAYRFVGLPEDELRWAGEYREKYPLRAVSPDSSLPLPPESFLAQM